MGAATRGSGGGAISLTLAVHWPGSARLPAGASRESGPAPDARQRIRWHHACGRMRTAQHQGLVALSMLAHFHGLACNPAQLAHELGATPAVISAADLLKAARSLGLKARLT